MLEGDSEIIDMLVAQRLLTIQLEDVETIWNNLNISFENKEKLLKNIPEIYPAKIMKNTLKVTHLNNEKIFEDELMKKL